jgi:hypothetical protein
LLDDEEKEEQEEEARQQWRERDRRYSWHCVAGTTIRQEREQEVKESGDR